MNAVQYVRMTNLIKSMTAAKRDLDNALISDNVEDTKVLLRIIADTCSSIIDVVTEH